ncbi:cytosine permease [Acidisoma cellulosilytica]|uniref:Cytosine permease n=1 Tax=Acidisoma cellulosilyticum TaxID=2802395 RepID=A0A964E2Q4_9PROT|nr:cytosine permease [Acidisoma cellulosilyticum]MCB8879482.1 cytosine permease [Acidisoma cellulosilyticum]
MSGQDLLGRIERRGIGFIPEAERHSSPRAMGFVFFGTQMTYGSVAIGALPVAFGLGWFSSFLAILAGTLIGAVFVAMMALMGPKSGTNGTVTSVAFFGLRGRYIGSFITQIIDLGFFAMILWVSAPPLVQAGHTLFGWGAGSVALTVALLLTALLVLALGIFGHATLVWSETIVSYASLIGLLVLAMVCLPHAAAAPNPKTNPLVLGQYWPSLMLAVTVTIANAISYAPFAGDYARYLPGRTRSTALFLWPFGGMVLGCLIACLCGEIIGLAVHDPFNPNAQMLAFLPHALILPVVLIGLIGNAANGAMVVYNGMLDLQAILWRLRRVQVGVIFGVVGFALAYLGLIVFGAANAILALCSIVTVLVTPWSIINIQGYLRQRGGFQPAALQAFGPAGPRSPYWYKGGFNLAAVIAWTVASVTGLMFSDTALFVGPLSQAAHGIDLSFLSAAVLAAILYPLLSRAFPDRD